MKEIDINNKTFEDIKHTDENGVEFWHARELQGVLDYILLASTNYKNAKRCRKNN